MEEKEDGEIDEEPESEAGAIFRMSADDFGSRLSAGGLSNGPPLYITEKNFVVDNVDVASKNNNNNHRD